MAEEDPRAERARELRRAGRSRRQIKEQLGVRSEKLLSEWLSGVPPVDGYLRGNHKDQLRAKAVAFRQRGWSYKDIRKELGVSISTLSLWLRDIPLTEDQRAALDARPREATARRASSTRAARIRRTELIQQAAAVEMGSVSDRELFVAGVALYWAEGNKAKPWSPSVRVGLINSDPSVITLFLKWLDLLGVSRIDLQFRIAIHESGDVAAAAEFWSAVVEADASTFLRPTLKRHKPTTRKNTGTEYHGCLIVGVRRSTDLNRRIAGWWAALLDGVSARPSR